jgi:hypothetical protein
MGTGQAKKRVDLLPVLAFPRLSKVDSLALAAASCARYTDMLFLVASW